MTMALHCCNVDNAENADQAWAQWALEAFLQLPLTLTSADMLTQRLTGYRSIYLSDLNI